MKEFKCCTECGRTKETKEFYSSYRLDKYPDGKMNVCKTCRTLMVDNWEPETYLDILEDADVPYIERVWNDTLQRYVDKDPRKINGTTVMGRYLSIMRMVQYKNYRWADTERIKEKEDDERRQALAKQGFNEDQIQAELSKDRTPERPEICEPTDQDPSSTLVSKKDEIMDQLSEEDIIYLTLKWGTGYNGAEWVKMEQLYNDMCSSYDIQTAGHKDTLIMICKASLKANQAIDAGDLESFQKISKVYDSLMKSGRFTAAQNAESETEGIDSVGQIVLICEKEGFIPRYYKDTPNDKADRVLQDIQKYTHDLVTEELGLGQMIENAIKSMQIEKERISESTEESDEDSLFAYEKTTSDTDVEDFINFKHGLFDDEGGADI